MEGPFTHLDSRGQARVVDVTEKETSFREAVARGRVVLGARAFHKLSRGEVQKGDVLAVARVAGILGAKRVDELIPLCHPLPLQGVEIDFALDAARHSIEIESRARICGVTGVEMEALMAVSLAALTIYDMCKSVDKGMIIENIHLVRKSGGKSGIWIKGG
jgi:cyclic pyranopterin phosphate synthase